MAIYAAAAGVKRRGCGWGKQPKFPQIFVAEVRGQVCAPMELTDGEWDQMCVDILIHGKVEKLHQYLDAGGDPNRLSHNRYSLGHYALMSPHNPSGLCCEILRILLEHGMSPNIGTDERLLHVCRYPEVAKILLDAGADVNAARSDPEVLGVRPIFACVTKAHGLGMTRVLLANGADLALTNSSGDDVEAFARKMAARPENWVSQNRFLAAADFIAEVKRAGSWKAYLKAPRVELVRLRSLCNRGRAAPPPDPILQRLFANVAASTNKPARTRRPLPNEVFWHVLQFWRTDRDD